MGSQVHTPGLRPVDTDSMPGDEECVSTDGGGWAGEQGATQGGENEMGMPDTMARGESRERV